MRYVHSAPAYCDMDGLYIMQSRGLTDDKIISPVMARWGLLSN